MTDVAAEGKCLARIDDMVVFAPFCVPGDVVDLQVTKKRKSYCEAKVIRTHKYILVFAVAANGRTCHTKSS